MRVTTYFYKLLSPLQNYDNNVLDRGSQLHTPYGELIERIEIVDQENYIIPVRETEVTKKAKNLEKKC